MRSLALPSPVMSTTGTNRVSGLAFIPRHTSKPVRPGIMTSSSANSTFTVAKRLTASSPSFASRTSYPSLCSMSSNIFRFASSSSAIKMTGGAVSCNEVMEVLGWLKTGSSCVQNRSYSLCEIGTGDGLLQKDNFIGEDAPCDDGIICIARHIDHAQFRPSLREAVSKFSPTDPWHDHVRYQQLNGPVMFRGSA